MGVRIIAYAPHMKVIVLGAGHVGAALVDSLHEDHEVVVVDRDDDRLAQFRARYDVRTVQGDGTAREELRKAGIERRTCLSRAVRARSSIWSAR